MSVVSQRSLVILASGPPADVGPGLRQATITLSSYPLQHLMTTLLLERLGADDELFAELRRYVAETGTDDPFTHVLLRLLTDMASHDVHRVDLMNTTLSSLVADETKSPGLRAHSLHLWAPLPRGVVAGQLRSLVDHGEPEVVAAAAHVLSWWQHAGHPVPEELEHALARRARSTPAVLARPEVVRALAGAPDPGPRTVVHQALQAETDPLTRAGIVQALVEQSDAEDAASVLDAVCADPDPDSVEAVEALRTVLATRPELVGEVYDAGRHSSYLHALELLPDLLDGEDGARLVTLEGSPDLALAARARRAILRAPEHGQLRQLQQALLGRPPSAPLVGLAQGTGAQASRGVMGGTTTVRAGYLLGYHKADALYRDLGFFADLPGVGNHYHTGVYCGFTVKSGGEIGRLSLVQAKGFHLPGPAGTIEVLKAEGVLAYPDLDVAAEMRELHSTFLRLFEDGQDGDPSPLRAVRRTPGLTAAKAEAIVATALALQNRHIGYTVLGMLAKRSWFEPWDGAVASIGAIRCDGVVEYAYERNGARVCSGGDPDHWDISEDGDASLDSHNRVHLGGYDRGELCPRVQAGVRGGDGHQSIDDTRMTATEGPTLPRISRFEVIPGAGPTPARLVVRVDSDRYDHVHVRLTVRRIGEGDQPGPLRFVETVDPFDVGVPEGPWRFVDCATGRDHTTFWLGDVVSGTRHETDGQYEFRVVAVDLAGNVSALVRTTADLSWS